MAVMCCAVNEPTTKLSFPDSRFAFLIKRQSSKRVFPIAGAGAQSSVYLLLTFPPRSIDPALLAGYTGDMKTIALLVLALFAIAPTALAGEHVYQYGRVLSFDTGRNAQKHAPKGDITYEVQIGAVIYKVTNHSKKPEFAAGEDVNCRVDKDRLFLRKPNGGEVRFDILAESAKPLVPAPAQPQ